MWSVPTQAAARWQVAPARFTLPPLRAVVTGTSDAHDTGERREPPKARAAAACSPAELKRRTRAASDARSR
jgi:hypothetical protein